jgi:hypothetical protein
MKNRIIIAAMAATILMAGCGKKTSSMSSPHTLPQEQASAASAATPVSQPALAAWQQGDIAAAVSSFVSADWSARPLFAADSPLSLSETQFKALSDADRQAKSSVMIAQLNSFKQLAAAVAQAGRDAAAKGDTAAARKDFTAVKACGMALDNPKCLTLVQLVGQALKKSADMELAKISQ